MESVSAGVSWERNHTRKEGGLLAPKMWSILASKLSKFRQPKPLLSAFWQINIGTKCYYYRRRLTLAGLSHPIPQLQPFFFLQKNEGGKALWCGYILFLSILLSCVFGTTCVETERVLCSCFHTYSIVICTSTT